MSEQEESRLVLFGNRPPAADGLDDITMGMDDNNLRQLLRAITRVHDSMQDVQMDVDI